MLLTLGAITLVGTAPVSCVDGSGHDDIAIQRLETALCDKRAACDCDQDDQFAPIDFECGDWPLREQGFFRMVDTSRAFDPGCVDRWEAWVDGLRCQAVALPRYEDVCPLYHGTIAQGMPCSGDNPLSTECDRDLFCLAGTCRDPQVTAFGGVDQPCDFGDRCDDDQLECNGGLCRRLPTAGEPCPDFRCDENARCDQDMRCQSLPSAGQSCLDGACSPGAFCDLDPMTGEGDCLGLLDLGDPCTGHLQCSSGNCPAGICKDPARPGEACSGTLPCGEDSFCVNFVCEAFPEDSAPLGSICEL